MRIIKIKKPGGPDVLEIAECDIPQVKENEVLIQVAFAGVNRPDIAQRKGHYPAPSDAPQDIPGLEVSGTIVDIGSQVKNFKNGDQVCALLSGGGYAEFAIAAEGQVMTIPKNLSLEQASCLPETVLTVWHNVFQRGQLKSGEILLVHGGTSGIGVMAIQMAKAFGAQVICTAGSEHKCRKTTELGANLSIPYKSASFVEESLRFTNNEGVDVILDMIGGEYTPLHLKLLKSEGRLVNINFMGGEQSTISWSTILRKRLMITGSTLRSRDAQFKSLLTQEVKQNVWPWLEQGKVVPVIDSIFPLEKSSEAHELMESSQHIGKILLNTTQSSAQN